MCICELDQHLVGERGGVGVGRRPEWIILNTSFAALWMVRNFTSEGICLD